jgi:DNA-binding NarL/FixJ family response regulator
MSDIILIDDHPLLRKGLARTLEGEDDLRVVGQMDRAEDALDALDDLEPDLAVVDISLPGMSGIEFLKHLQSRAPEVRALVVSRHDEGLYAERCLRAGAKGYVMKQEAGDGIVDAVRAVLDGRVFVSDEINDRLLRSMSEGGRERMMQSPLDLLSDRELEVFELIGNGLSTHEVAERLHLSVKTIESYRSRVKDKLHFDSSNELMKHAVQWVESEDSL